MGIQGRPSVDDEREGSVSAGGVRSGWTAVVKQRRPRPPGSTTDQWVLDEVYP